ncbi:calcyon neuron specific vesicular protein [Homo sapiens]|uniref:Isoform 3 of Neuron-specific vesicular protein calcyon n=1 Tax=Homo sapiens TaxID=9606 RepID=Q9NYX4-3|nr:calcyon neuron specific vesicular protein [Homo sapiens]KAI4077920.1 calcyon neuron specific vesicular protein [Homo sapiens]
MVKLGCSFSGKPGKDPGDQDGAAMDSVPLISPLDISQLQPPLPDQVVIKTQTEYQLSSPDQQNFPDLEGQRLNCSHPEEGRRVTTPTPPTVGTQDRRRRWKAAGGAWVPSRPVWGPLALREERVAVSHPAQSWPHRLPCTHQAPSRGCRCRLTKQWRS